MKFNSTVMVKAEYTVHVDLPFYPMGLHVAATTENKGIF